MYMYVRLQVHLAPIPYDSTCVTVSMSIAVFVSVFVAIAATTATNIFLYQILPSKSHLSPCPAG